MTQINPQSNTPPSIQYAWASAPKRWLDLQESSGMVLVFIGLFIALSLFVPNFLNIRNLEGLLLSVCLIGTIAVTMMLVLACGEVDLSVASIVAFAGVVAATLIAMTSSVWIGVLGGVLAGTVVGLANGLVVAKLGMNSLIATLGSMEIVRGLAYIVSKGDAVMITEESFFVLGSGEFLGVTYPIWVMLIAFILFGVLLNRTVFGKSVLAIGGNAEAARLAGIAVSKVKIMVFTLQGAAAGLAGVLLTSRLSIGDPKTSIGLELGIISACVLGGVSLSGGIASISGVLVGVLIMGAVQNGMSLMNVPTFYQYLIRGGILLIAVVFDIKRQQGRTKT
jgi:L-arabinose transport system permease protein